MANELAKYLNSRRRQKDGNAIARQLKIARQHGLTDSDKAVKQPHRMVKHHGLDCGRPQCYLCGNPRRTHKDKLSIQEKRFPQDLESDSDGSR